MLTVLIIDDEEAIFEAVEFELEIDGEYKVQTALGGYEAANKLAEVNPDVVLLDWTMPEGDGSWFLNHIKSLNFKFEIVVFTGNDSLSREEVLALGGKGLIRKGEGDFLVKFKQILSEKE